MLTTALILVTTLMATFSGWALFRRTPAFTANLDRYGVPRSWWPWLGAVKIAGGVGVLLGLWWPWLGAVAAGGLALYFGGAVFTVARSGIIGHLAIPLVYLAPPAVACFLLLGN